MIRNKFEKLTVSAVEMRNRNDGSGKFPVVIIQGISFQMSESGNQSFSKRKVSLPLNGMELDEAKQLFPVGSTIDGYRIAPYEVEPYEFSDPDTGEVVVATRRYRLIPLDQPATEETASAPQSTREPVKQAPSEVGTEAKQSEQSAQPSASA